MTAMRSRPDALSRLARATGTWRTFVKICRSAPMPQCCVSFKNAAINATIGAATAGFSGLDQGLGFYIQIVTGTMRPDIAFAGICFFTVLGLGLFGLVTLAERLLIPWHVSVRRNAH